MDQQYTSFNEQTFEKVWSEHDLQAKYVWGMNDDGIQMFFNNGDYKNDFTYSDNFLSTIKTICQNIAKNYLSQPNITLKKITKKGFANSQKSITFDIVYEINGNGTEKHMQINYYGEEINALPIPDSIGF